MKGLKTAVLDIGITARELQRHLVTVSGFLNLSVLVFMTALIAAAALSPAGVVEVPLSNTAEVAGVIAASIVSLTLFPDLWRAMDISLARHYCRHHFLGTSWRVRRITIAFGAGCILTSPVVLLGAYLLAVLCPLGKVAFNVNALGEALPELLMFAGLGVPAATYACASAIGVQKAGLATFRQLFRHPHSGTIQEWRQAARSLFDEDEWELIVMTRRMNRRLSVFGGDGDERRLGQAATTNIKGIFRKLKS
ncbi:MAG: hypothetical protein H5T49_02920 [Hadesarchaea archaeon]|nr:hypothetical protein [Hadesarchaea archaeon]